MLKNNKVRIIHTGTHVMMRLVTEIISLYCSFCGSMIRQSDSQKCVRCGASFCQKCASHLEINGRGLKCPCGSSEIEPSPIENGPKAEAVEVIFELKKSLKQVGYRPVLALKRTGHLDTRLKEYKKQFLNPRNEIDQIFLETKKIESFVLTEFLEFAAKLKRLYRSVMGLEEAFTDHRNLSLQISLFQKQVTSFDQTVLNKLEPIHEMINLLETKCDEFDQMAKELGRYFDIFFFIPGELGIGFFSGIELHNGRIRKTPIDLSITTDRIVMFQKKRTNIVGQKAVIYDEFPPEDLIDVQKKATSGFIKRDTLQITTIKHDYELRSDHKTLMRIFDALQLAYYGRPSDIYVHEPFRDWSSEIFQEKILSAINFQSEMNDGKSKKDSSSQMKEEPDFVTGVLDDRLRDLRIRKLANERALQELKEGRKKVASRDYFELIKEFELELAKINEAITELLIRTGKTNLLN